MPRFVLPCLSTALLLVIPSLCQAAETHPYPACNRQPSEADVQAAKGAFQAGNVSFNERDYDRAILYWEDAFRRDCSATLLLHNLSRAYEGKANLDQAVVALRTFLDRSPEYSERPQLERAVESMEKNIAEQQQRHNAPPAPVPAPAATQAAAGDDKAPASVSTGPSKPFPLGPVLAGSLVGVGVLAAGFGTYAWLTGQSDVTNAEQSCGGSRSGCPTSAAQQGNDGRSQITLGQVSLGAGTALIAAGAGWFFYNGGQLTTKSAAAEPQRLWAPWVGRTSAGLSWQGSF